MPATVTRPAARAFPRDAATPMSVPSTIPAEPSASTVRRKSVCTIPTTNVMQNMWTSGAAARTTANRHCAQRSGRPEELPIVSFAFLYYNKNVRRKPFGLRLKV